MERWTAKFRMQNAGLSNAAQDAGITRGVSKDADDDMQAQVGWSAE